MPLKADCCGAIYLKMRSDWNLCQYFRPIKTMKRISSIFTRYSIIIKAHIFGFLEIFPDNINNTWMTLSSLQESIREGGWLHCLSAPPFPYARLYGPWKQALIAFKFYCIVFDWWKRMIIKQHGSLSITFHSIRDACSSLLSFTTDFLFIHLR